MEYRDYYATLGVDKGATQADIKKAYRRLARKHHPDVNKGDSAAEQRFKEVSEANEVLSDPQKRKAYDQLGANWAAYERAGGSGADPFAGFAGAAGGSPGGMRFEFRGDATDLSGFSDFFRAFFGGGGARGATAAASAGGRAGTATSGDPAGLGFEPLFGGVGGDSGAGYAASGFGTGSPRSTRRPVYRAPTDATADTTVSLEEVLRGTERHIDVGGKRLEVRIPSGVADGQRIRLSGKAQGGGHIYLTVHVARHPVFTRDGDHLGMDLPLTLGEALLGGQVSFEALGGKRLLLTIPPGTQNGRLFRLAGQGLPHFGGGDPGDLRVRTSIVLPASLDEEGTRRARSLVDHIAQPDPRLATTARRQPQGSP
jgi:DnaJ-class molecular chaperone